MLENLLQPTAVPGPLKVHRVKSHSGRDIKARPIAHICCSPPDVYNQLGICDVQQDGGNSCKPFPRSASIAPFPSLPGICTRSEGCPRLISVRKQWRPSITWMTPRLRTRSDGIQILNPICAFDKKLRSFGHFSTLGIKEVEKSPFSVVVLPAPFPPNKRGNPALRNT